MTPGEGRPLDDQELVERAQRGDPSAYENLVRRYQVPVVCSSQFISDHKKAL
jgi:hypothetical protein